MKIVLAGGSGQVGTLLARHWHAAGHDVVVLGRTAKPAAWRTVPWDGGAAFRSRSELGAWALANGFAFQHPQWPAAAADLVARWRALRG